MHAADERDEGGEGGSTCGIPEGALTEFLLPKSGHDLRGLSKCMSLRASDGEKPISPFLSFLSTTFDLYTVYMHGFML